MLMTDRSAERWTVRPALVTVMLRQFYPDQVDAKVDLVARFAMQIVIGTSSWDAGLGQTGQELDKVIEDIIWRCLELEEEFALKYYTARTLKGVETGRLVIKFVEMLLESLPHGAIVSENSAENICAGISNIVWTIHGPNSESIPVIQDFIKLYIERLIAPHFKTDEPS
jgi:hypothetical protein